MLNNTYTALLLKYSDNQQLINKLWNDVVTNYNSVNRFYHNLLHIENMINELISIKNYITNWDSVLFAAFYHDIVYDTKQYDNELKSAAYAHNVLKSFDIQEDMILLCENHILATKGHTITGANDTDLFTDADLSILGQNWQLYSQYSQNIRKEYANYPDDLYAQGRKTVLLHFLNFEKIFKTNYFYDKYENNARKNITSELNQLLLS